MSKIINFFFNRKKIIKKIFLTLIVVFIYIIGTRIYIPVLTKDQYFLLIFKEKMSKSFVDMFNMNILGENSRSLCLLSLGIIPYITSSIIMQFAVKFLPFLKELNEQGERGKKKISLITRCLTIIFAIGQGLSLILRTGIINFKENKIVCLKIIFFLIVGVFICIWLADLVTSKGIGNGISLLIVIGISKELFNTFKNLLYVNNKFLSIYLKILICFLFLFLLILTVILCSAYLKIPIKYAYKKNIQDIEQNIPLKINTAGVLPIILANTIISIIPTISVFTKENSFFKKIEKIFFESRFNYLGIGFYIYLLLIIFFSFFSVFITINPNDVAEHLSKKDAFLENIKPGKQTVYKITGELLKISIIGTVFLTILAALPDLIGYFFNIQQYIRFSGTSFIIIVGVSIEYVENIMTKTNVKNFYNKLF
ncbi:MAG: preprotein translocase subunit [Candidatus Phytoplasma cynodontis]|uniref:preprotein translocase subunit SecY n=1 Tax='Cynodon dactylon' phytoplasma TaxID=295320 RepID=UPI001265D664|nr:preprotein translocase subunit SecY ['Cynodon dactylon' phytoplasma]KAB8121967.1 preprotein translocase subunit SecY ['Cynodon dactylon' phytoplasma]WIA07619.1 MAG: preprotein translocase subunit [Candidatus Phytoplasma cynodontis]